jgi:hypothetical protein
MRSLVFRRSDRHFFSQHPYLSYACASHLHVCPALACPPHFPCPAFACPTLAFVPCLCVTPSRVQSSLVPPSLVPFPLALSPLSRACVSFHYACPTLACPAVSLIPRLSVPSCCMLFFFSFFRAHSLEGNLRKLPRLLGRRMEQPKTSRTTKVETDERWSRLATKVRCAEQMCSTGLSHARTS